MIQFLCYFNDFIFIHLKDKKKKNVFLVDALASLLCVLINRSPQVTSIEFYLKVVKNGGQIKSKEVSVGAVAVPGGRGRPRGAGPLFRVKE